MDEADLAKKKEWTAWKPIFGNPQCEWPRVLPGNWHRRSDAIPSGCPLYLFVLAKARFQINDVR
jgi:hypothetical protein